MERGHFAKWVLAAGLAALLADGTAVRGLEWPPYDVYGYLADAGDNPPLNYMKVCDPGSSGEENASYVVLGISWPRTFQAVATGYDGDLRIPASIDGLPVRAIGEAAFLQCTKLRSVSIPATVRDIGDRAFADCWQLTNVTFEAGVSRVGDAAFSNCISLAEIDFPATLSRLGTGCFQGCVELRDVHFRGNAPRLGEPGADLADGKSCLGESIFRQTGYGPRFRVHIDPATSGWIAPEVKGVPEKWPVDFGYMRAHPTVAEPSGGGDAPAPEGLAAVITQIDGSPGALAIPGTWAARFPGYTGRFGTDFAASLTLPTGKRDASGAPLAVWQDYVAGTDPTDAQDCFRAWIEVEDGTVRIAWTPVLAPDEAAKRTYALFGRRSLFDGDWEPVPPGRETDYNFFKLAVGMK